MNKKLNRLLDSSKIQQDSLHKKRVKRDKASGNIGKNMNSEFRNDLASLEHISINSLSLSLSL